MKIMKTLVLILLLFCNISLSAQTGTWKIVDSVRSKVYQTMSLKAIDCVDTLNCAVLGNYGWTWPLITSTEDGGNTWNLNYIDSISKGDQDLYIPANEICYADTTLCIMICDEGYYYVSRDKCKTWEKSRLGKDLLNRISFLNKDVGVINSFYCIYITSDGARSWEAYRHDSLNIDTNYLPETTNNIFVLSKDIMFGIFYRQEIKYLVKTIDGGKTWSYISTFPESVQNIVFLDEKTGFVAGRPKVNTNKYKNIIYKTTDGGKTWENKLDSLSAPYRGLKQIYFSDKQNGVALASGWDLWRTSDGGESWIRDTSYYWGRFGDYGADIALLGSTKKFLIANESNSFIIKYSEDETTDVSGIIKEPLNKMALYPNIINGGGRIKIEISSYIPGNCKLEVYNSIGLLIDKFEFSMNGDAYSIDYIPHPGLATGQYFIVLNSFGSKFSSLKFLIIK